ncbi:MAG: hypothetical protein MJZ38_03140 [archaeon]|nr:hypothetical protein [archaeon]
MKIELNTLGIILTLAGLVLAVLGMLSFTGLAVTGIPSGVMFTGYPITLAGLIILWSDLRANRGLLEDTVAPVRTEDEVLDEDPLFLTDFKEGSDSDTGRK